MLAEELAVLQDVCGQIGDLLKEGLEVSPRRTLIEFLAAVQIADEDPDCVPHVVRKVDSEQIKKLLEQEVKRRE